MKNTYFAAFAPKDTSANMSISQSDLSAIMSVNQSITAEHLEHEPMSIQAFSHSDYTMLTDRSPDTSEDEMSTDDLSEIDPLDDDDHTLDWDLSTNSETTGNFTTEDLESLEALIPQQLNNFRLFIVRGRNQELTESNVEEISSNSLSLSL